MACKGVSVFTWGGKRYWYIIQCNGRNYYSRAARIYKCTQNCGDRSLSFSRLSGIQCFCKRKNVTQYNCPVGRRCGITSSGGAKTVRIINGRCLCTPYAGV